MRLIRPRLGVWTESTATPGGENTNYERHQLENFDQSDDGDADPESKLSADVRDEPDDVVVRRFSCLDDVTVSNVNNDASQQMTQR